jgi:hypothetical protein
MSRVARHPSRKRSRAIGVRIFLERELWGINEISFSDSYVKQALAGSLAGEKSEAFEYPGIVAEIVAQEGEVLAVGRRDAPSFGALRLRTWDIRFHLMTSNHGLSGQRIISRARNGLVGDLWEAKSTPSA